MKQCPKGEALRTVCRQTKADFHVLDAGRESFRRNRCQICSAEIAADLIIEIHRCYLIQEQRGGKSVGYVRDVGNGWKMDMSR